LLKVRHGLRFARATIAIARHPTATADDIVQSDWPGGIGPKLYAGLAVALFLAVGPLSNTGRAGWIDTFGELSATDQAAFLDHFGIDSNELDKYEVAESLWAGSSPLSQNITVRAGSTSETDIGVSIGHADPELARHFFAAAKYHQLTEKIDDWILRVGPLLLSGAAA
jgi:hypothetical protein